MFLPDAAKTKKVRRLLLRFHAIREALDCNGAVWLPEHLEDLTTTVATKIEHIALSGGHAEDAPYLMDKVRRIINAARKDLTFGDLLEAAGWWTRVNKAVFDPESKELAWISHMPPYSVVVACVWREYLLMVSSVSVFRSGAGDKPAVYAEREVVVHPEDVDRDKITEILASALTAIDGLDMSLHIQPGMEKYVEKMFKFEQAALAGAPISQTWASTD